MFCACCNRFTLPIEQLSSKGRMNKLCNKCLKHATVDDFQYLADIESIYSVELFPKRYFIISKNDISEMSIEHFSEELSDLLLDKYGYKFRYMYLLKCRFDKKTDDTYYGFCSLSEYYQKKGPEKRKRLNFGYERFKCDGKLNIHYNDDYISIMIMHQNDHVKVKK